MNENKKMMNLNDFEVINTLYHEARRLRYYTLMKLGYEVGADKIFDDYGVNVYDYWVDFGSFANAIGRMNEDDYIDCIYTIEDIVNDMKHYQPTFNSTHGKIEEI